MKRKKKYNTEKQKISIKELRNQAILLLESSKYDQVEIKECVKLIKKPKKVLPS